MVDVDMSLTPLKVIVREACLRAKGIYRLSKDLGPKRCPNTWRKEGSKEIRDFVKVKDGGVHCKRYDGRCTKQRIRIPKATWTSPILRRRSTCQTFFSMTYLMKDDVKVKMPNKTPQNSNSFEWGGKLGWGVEVWWQARGWPCYAFLRLDRKTYNIKFGRGMFICRWYN
jgi:hypothetical protein